MERPEPPRAASRDEKRRYTELAKSLPAAAPASYLPTRPIANVGQQSPPPCPDSSATTANTSSCEQSEHGDPTPSSSSSSRIANQSVAIESWTSNPLVDAQRQHLASSLPLSEMKSTPFFKKLLGTENTAAPPLGSFCHQEKQLESSEVSSTRNSIFDHAGLDNAKQSKSEASAEPLEQITGPKKACASNKPSNLLATARRGTSTPSIIQPSILTFGSFG